MRQLGYVGVVAAGGAVGVFARAVLWQAWPWFGTTFFINILGAFLLGGILEVLGNGPPWRHILRLGIGTGLLGGFTTYSTFSLEVVQLWQSTPWLGMGYAASSLVAGIAAALFGMWLVQLIKQSSADNEADA